MRKGIVYCVAISLMVPFCLAGCAKQEVAESGRAAISQAAQMETTEAKVKYLIGQAKAMYNSEKFQDAIDVARYILRWLDKDSQAAKDLLREAQSALRAKAQGVVESMNRDVEGVGY